MHCMTALMTHRNDVKEVRLFGLGDFLLHHFQETFEAFRARHQALRQRHWLTTVALSALSAGAQAAGFPPVLFAAVEGRISLGDFLFYTTALSQIRAVLNGIVQQVASLYEANLYVGTLFELQAVQETLPVPPPETARRVAAPLRQGIELRHVGFTYPGAERAVLRASASPSRRADGGPGRGANGAGKTTLVKLLSRLYDPTAGRSSWTGRTCASTTWRTCAGRSAASSRTTPASSSPRGTTSASGRWTAWRTCERIARRRRRGAPSR